MEYIQVTNNEALLLGEILKEIKNTEKDSPEVDEEFTAEVSFKYKATEKRLLASIINKLSQIRPAKVIKTTID